MKIALTVWGDRISPVFDAAAMLLLAKIEDGRVLEKNIVPFNPAMLPQLTDLLKQMEVSVLVCGAISEFPAHILSINGVKLIPFVSGKTDHVLDLYAKGKSVIPAFAMPGIGRQRRTRGRRPGYGSQRPKEVKDMPRKDGTGPAGGGPGTGQGRGGCRPQTGGSGRKGNKGSRRGQGCGGAGQGKGRNK